MRRRLSILFVHDASSVCETLAKEALEAGDEVRLVLPRKGLTTYPSLGSRATVISGGRTATIEAYSKSLLRGDYDVVVSCSRLSWVLGGAAAKAFRAKAVTILMGSDIRRFWSVSPVERAFFERGLRRSSLIYYASPDTAPLAGRFGVPSELLRFPIDTSVFNPSGDAARLEGTPAVFVPTRLDIDKGTGPIAHLVKHILGSYEEAVVHLVRWPNTQGAVQQLAGIGSPKRIRLAGFLRRREMARRYRGASVLVGQMKLGFGSMTEMEALACGLPSVYYDRFGSYGSRTNDDGEIAEFFDRLITDEGFRRSKVQEGLETVSRENDSRKVYASFRERVSQLVE